MTYPVMISTWSPHDINMISTKSRRTRQLDRPSTREFGTPLANRWWQHHRSICGFNVGDLVRNLPFGDGLRHWVYHNKHRPVLATLAIETKQNKFLFCVIPACSSPESEGGTLQKWAWKIACKNSLTSSNPQKWLWKMLSLSTYSTTFTTLGFRNSQGCLLKALLSHSEGPEAIERDERQGLWWSLIAGKNWYKLIVQKMNGNIISIIAVLLY